MVDYKTTRSNRNTIYGLLIIRGIKTGLKKEDQFLNEILKAVISSDAPAECFLCDCGHIHHCLF